jgi:acetolactate synthase-1/2/3 large subunit
MGYGLPAAIGAQIAFPNEYIVCISGDSSFQMCLQELGTIGQNKLPIRIIIINNYWQGMVRQWQESFYDNRYSHSNMSDGQPNFLALANSYGIESTSIENEKELIKSLIKYKDYSAPVLFNCLVVENENCYPMVSPGATNAAMTGIKYNQDEIELLKRHSDENDDIDSFLSNVKTE